MKNENIFEREIFGPDITHTDIYLNRELGRNEADSLLTARRYVGPSEFGGAVPLP